MLISVLPLLPTKLLGNPGQMGIYLKVNIDRAGHDGTPRRWRQEDCFKFLASLGYVVSARPVGSPIKIKQEHKRENTCCHVGVGTFKWPPSILTLSSVYLTRGLPFQCF